MVKYRYSRELVNNVYNLDNPDRVVDGEQIRLANEISNAFPNKTFTTNYSGEIAEIIFSEELTAEEKQLLDSIVQNHKDNL